MDRGLWRWCAAAVCLSLASCGGGTDSGAPVSQEVVPGGTTPAATVPPALPAWQLVWQDEFDTNGLPDAAKWDYDTEFNQRGWWNGELQYYSRARTENARVEDGKLFITARRERIQGRCLCLCIAITSQPGSRIVLTGDPNDIRTSKLLSGKHPRQQSPHTTNDSQHAKHSVSMSIFHKAKI